MRTMGRAKSIVHIHVGQRGKRLCEASLVRLFFRMKAQVFEQEHVARLQDVDQVLHDQPHAVRRCPHLSLQQLAEADTNRTETVGGVWLALWPAEVRTQDGLCLVVGQVLDCWERSADARVITDSAILQRYVEINANQDTLAKNIEVTHRF